MTNEEKIILKWNSLTIKDNFIFGKTMELNPDLCKRLIEQILNIKIKSLDYPEREKTIESRLDSKGIRLDVYVEDDAHRSFDIEIQLTDNDNLSKRMRYYHSLIDLDKLHKGKSIKYQSLGESFVIFICTFDVFGYGYQLYDFDIVCKRNPQIKFNDLTHRIFLCTEGNDNEISAELKNFLDYVAGRGINGNFIRELDDAVQKVKISKEWRLNYMTYELALLEREELGEERGREEERNSIAFNLIKMGMKFEDISKATLLSIDKIKEIAQTIYRKENCTE